MWYKQINIRFVKQDEVWKKKNRSLSTSCDNDEDTASIDKGNFYLHLLIMMKKQPPTTYYDIAHQPIIIQHIKGNN